MSALTGPLSQLLAVDLLSYALVFARVGAMVATMPAFGENMAPARVRLLIALALTLLFTPIVPRQGMSAEAGPLAVAGPLILEILIGLSVGFAARMLMAAVQVAGSVIALQLGLSFATSVDPAQGSHGAILSTFLSLLALTLIFATETHHLLVMAMQNSYVLFPQGVLPSARDFMELAIKFAAFAFALGVQISAPFLVFGLVFQIASGVVARLMPQIQIFFLTVPLSMLAGFVIFMASLSAMMMVFVNAFQAELAPLAGG